MAAEHSASPSCNPPALVWLTLATLCRLALTGWAPSLPLHHSSVPKQLLPRGSWPGTARHSCGATAHTMAHKARTQHHKPLPASFRGRSHFQGILNTLLTSPWPTPVKMLGGYADQIQGTHCFKKQNLLQLPAPLLRIIVDNLLHQKQDFYSTVLPR